jgi:hypothetical protein
MRNANMKGKSGRDNFYGKIKDFYTEFLMSTFRRSKCANSSTLINSMTASAMIRVQMAENVS